MPSGEGTATQFSQPPTPADAAVEPSQRYYYMTYGIPLDRLMRLPSVPKPTPKQPPAEGEAGA
jgi:hypothetical protein